MFGIRYFHPGDGYVLPRLSNGACYTIPSPVAGVISGAGIITEDVGYYVHIKTPFSATTPDGKTGQVTVYIVHHDGLVPSLLIGMYVNRGDPLVRLCSSHGSPVGDWFLDMGGFVGNHVQANETLPDFDDTVFLNMFDYLQDDLDSLPPDSFTMMPVMNGNPVPQP